MKILVQKFGGTSVASPELREQVVNKISRAYHDGYSVVVVVSAMGRKGDPYATDTLIELAKGDYSDLSKRELDIIMSCGEIISGTVMTRTLQASGFDAVLLTGAQAGIITDKNFSDAKILRIDPVSILKALKEEKIVVVTGFQGASEDGEITTLGRGGSDTTAAALGVALHAECVDIFTDVEGIMTADPRIVEEAQILDTITYYEVCNLAQEGAKVIHPRAVEIAMQKNIPLRIKCTFSDAPGTTIGVNSKTFELVTNISKDRLITGVTHVPNIAQIKIFTNTVSDPKELDVKIFKAMALSNISVDFINVHPHAVIFTVKSDDINKAVKVLENLDLQPEVLPNCAKVSVVGANMAGVPGVMATIVEALAKENIQILQSADSHTTIWCLVKNDDMAKAVRTLHKQFTLSDK